jgi:hypothetical protein
MAFLVTGDRSVTGKRPVLRRSAMLRKVMEKCLFFKSFRAILAGGVRVCYGEVTASFRLTKRMLYH